MSGFTLKPSVLSGVGRGRPVDEASRIGGMGEGTAPAKGFGRGNVLSMPDMQGNISNFKLLSQMASRGDGCVAADVASMWLEDAPRLPADSKVSSHADPDNWDDEPTEQGSSNNVAAFTGKGSSAVENVAAKSSSSTFGGRPSKVVTEASSDAGGSAPVAGFGRRPGTAEKSSFGGRPENSGFAGKPGGGETGGFGGRPSVAGNTGFGVRSAGGQGSGFGGRQEGGEKTGFGGRPGGDEKTGFGGRSEGGDSGSFGGRAGGGDNGGFGGRAGGGGFGGRPGGDGNTGFGDGPRGGEKTGFGGRPGGGEKTGFGGRSEGGDNGSFGGRAGGGGNGGFGGRPGGDGNTGFGGRPGGGEKTGFGGRPGGTESRGSGGGFGGRAADESGAKGSQGGFGGRNDGGGSGFGGGFSGAAKSESGGFGGPSAFEASVQEGGGGACRVCQEEGHFARECPNKECRKCKQKGHFAKDCEIKDKCIRCGSEDHFIKECPQPEKCRNCGKEGHGHDDCVNPREEGEDAVRVPVTYVPEEKTEEVLFSEHINAGINFSKYDQIPVQRSGDNSAKAIRSFAEANLCERLLENVKKLEYSKPTPIQMYALPTIMSGRDVMGCAQTGSGKTAAYLLPILHHLLSNWEEKSDEESMKTEPKALIVAPTRELATQIYYEAKKFAMGGNVKAAVIYGGVRVSYQISMAKGCDLLVATPGRMKHLLEGDEFGAVKKGELSLKKVKFFVMDEADSMLDMGFKPDMERVMEADEIPKAPQRQTLMFSATMPEEIQMMAKKYLMDHAFITVGLLGGANTDIVQHIIEVSQPDKNDKILEMLKEDMKASIELGDHYEKKTLVFVERKKNADFLGSFLSLSDLKATTIHGDRFQKQREKALNQFKQGDCPILIATHVAARGLDIRGVDHVINYDLPQTIEEYVHRIGRTGRVGNPGRATSFYDSDSDLELAPLLLKVFSDAQQIVPDFLQNEANKSGPTPGGEKVGGSGFPDTASPDKEEDDDDW